MIPHSMGILINHIKCPQRTSSNYNRAEVIASYSTPHQCLQALKTCLDRFTRKDYEKRNEQNLESMSTTYLTRMHPYLKNKTDNNYVCRTTQYKTDCGLNRTYQATFEKEGFVIS